MIHDLHMHSSASDGSLDPAELVDYVREHGVDVMSITDHDTVDAYAALKDVELGGVTLIPGIELSTTWMGRGVHVVGLNIDIETEALQSGIAAQTAARHQRAELIADRLARAGIDHPLEAVAALAGNTAIGRPHFARHLVDTGVVRNVRAAFQKYLGAGKPGDVRMLWAELPEVVEWIRLSGGIAVLAHPAKYGLTWTRLRALLDDFRRAGGAGIEVVCGRQDDATTRRLATLASEFGLAASSGSDFHSPKQHWTRPGGFPPLPSQLEPVWTRW
ncbi:MAG: PHP domain-containing protein [Pseudomonadota bacterium]